MSDIPGSCVGSLNHVYHDYYNNHKDEVELAPLAVITDPVRLKMLLPEKEDIHLPQELSYIFNTQFKEADLIVLNKIDLLAEDEKNRMMDFLRQVYPDVPVIAISAKERINLKELAEYVMSHGTKLKNVEVSYEDKAFIAAQQHLTWYNRRFFLKTRDGSNTDFNPFIDDYIEAIRQGLKEIERNVPHLKIFARSDEDFCKASLIGVDYSIEYARKLTKPHKDLRFIINIRAVCESKVMDKLAEKAYVDTVKKYDYDDHVFFTECYGVLDEGL